MVEMEVEVALPALEVSLIAIVEVCLLPSAVGGIRGRLLQSSSFAQRCVGHPSNSGSANSNNLCNYYFEIAWKRSSIISS